MRKIDRRTWALEACREQIYGEGTSESLQRVIDLARVAVGADPMPAEDPETWRLVGKSPRGRRAAMRGKIAQHPTWHCPKCGRGMSDRTRRHRCHLGGELLHPDDEYLAQRKLEERSDREVLAYEDGRIETAESIRRDQLRQDMEADLRVEAAEHKEDDDG